MSAAETRLAAVIGAEKISTSLLDRVAYSCDASLYQLVPRAIVRVESIADVRELFAWSRREKVPITFRAAGTSLSGQAVTSHVLVLVRGFNAFGIEQQGEYVLAGSSLRGGYVNARLRPYHRRIGPDPASIDSCTIGGIVANNASGMCCGIAQNAYHTLAGMTIVLPSGTVIDTRDLAAADAILADQEPHLYNGIMQLQKEIRSNTDLVRLIRHRTRLKNTMGYSLAAFLDYDRPADVLQHLLVGSEGTLAFIADVTLRTIKEPPFAVTGLLEFDSMTSACESVTIIADTGAIAIELMDAATLHAIDRYAKVGQAMRLPKEAVLLVEYRFDEPERADRFRADFAQLLREASVRRLFVASNEQERRLLWQLRKGAMPSVGAARPAGTVLINEDVAFPREHLASAVGDLRRLLNAYQFNDAVIFGHARDGNMHFAFSLDPGVEGIDRYGAFMDELASLVVERYDGSLKAEHSTGRNMAPFLEQQWGKTAVEMMWRIKQLFDPEHLLNADVILTRDSALHLRNIKTIPDVHPLIDRCIECGFCERVCPSSSLTLSPRQRIIVLRQIKRCRSKKEQGVLEREFVYAGNQTCAADGMCAIACPVGVNTGEMMIEQRQHSPEGSLVWNLAWRNVGWWIHAVGAALQLAHTVSRMIGARIVEQMTATLARRLHLPAWLATIGTPEIVTPTPTTAPALVYMPSCMVCFGGRQAERSVIKALYRLSERAGVPIVIAQSAGKVCCGHPWYSRGLRHQYQHVLQQWIAAALDASDNGRLPIVLDSSSCQLSLHHARWVVPTLAEQLNRLTIVGPIEAAEKLLMQINATPLPAGRVLVHPPCSSRHLNDDERLCRLLQECGFDVIVPHLAWCCGMAGDRGLRYPELPAAALHDEASEISAVEVEAALSTNLPCQWQLSHLTKREFIHLWCFLEQWLQ